MVQNLNEAARKRLEASMKEEAELAPKTRFSRLRTYVGLSWYRAKMKGKIIQYKLRNLFTNESVQAAGMMVGLNAMTGMISVKMVMQNGDETVCFMDVDNAEALKLELEAAMSSVSMKR